MLKCLQKITKIITKRIYILNVTYSENVTSATTEEIFVTVETTLYISMKKFFTLSLVSSSKNYQLSYKFTLVKSGREFKRTFSGTDKMFFV